MPVVHWTRTPVVAAAVDHPSVAAGRQLVAADTLGRGPLDARGMNGLAAPVPGWTDGRDGVTVDAREAVQHPPWNRCTHGFGRDRAMFRLPRVLRCLQLGLTLASPEQQPRPFFERHHWLVGRPLQRFFDAFEGGGLGDTFRLNRCFNRGLGVMLPTSAAVRRRRTGLASATGSGAATGAPPCGDPSGSSRSAALRLSRSQRTRTAETWSGSSADRWLRTKMFISRIIPRIWSEGTPNSDARSCTLVLTTQLLRQVPS